MKKPFLVGVTGGIGSGKTTVVNIFKDLEVPVYIADNQAKRLMVEDKSLISKIKKTFGDKSYVNGSLNKAYISKIVFEDKSKLKQLNEIVHPAVRSDFNNWAKEQNSAYVIYESALIFEHEQQQYFDSIILVTAPRHLRIKRVKNRSGLSEKDIKRRMQQQMDDKLKESKSNYIIENIYKRDIKEKVNRINIKILDIIKNKS